MMNTETIPLSDRELKDSDFDGHTQFDSMIFEEKLRWVSEAVERIYAIQMENKSLFTKI